jgi:hypothetical protein
MQTKQVPAAVQAESKEDLKELMENEGDAEQQIDLQKQAGKQIAAKPRPVPGTVSPPAANADLPPPPAAVTTAAAAVTPSTSHVPPSIPYHYAVHVCLLVIIFLLLFALRRSKAAAACMSPGMSQAMGFGSAEKQV